MKWTEPHPGVTAPVAFGDDCGAKRLGAGRRDHPWYAHLVREVRSGGQDVLWLRAQNQILLRDERSKSVCGAKRLGAGRRHHPGHAHLVRGVRSGGREILAKR